MSVDAINWITMFVVTFAFGMGVGLVIADKDFRKRY